VPTVTLTPVNYPGAQVTVQLNGDVPTPSGGIAKWRQISRPRRRDVLEFDSEDPLKLAFGIMLEQQGGEVESLCGRIYGWAARNSFDEPTVVHIAGPVPYPELDYVITKIDVGDEVRRGPDGQRWRQELRLELTEYQRPDLITQSPSPAAAATAAASAPSSPATTDVLIQAATGGGSSKTYTVRKGDTLSAIAARQLGNANRWQDIANLNGVRDPRTLKVGQVLKLP